MHFMCPVIFSYLRQKMPTMKLHCKNLSTVLCLEGDILNRKLPKESIKNFHFVQMFSILTYTVSDKEQIVNKIGKGKKGWKRISKASFRPGITVDQGPFSGPMVKWHNVTCMHTDSLLYL